MSRQPKRSSSKAARAALLDLFRRMWLLRAFEETVAAAQERRQLPGLLHLSNGAEAVALGVISQLTPEDRIYSTHRPHGHFLAAGADPRALMA
ncbi:MAG: thiamine pyrophosphate-dependent enzyme, partial [Anaerolineales bacterium]